MIERGRALRTVVVAAIVLEARAVHAGGFEIPDNGAEALGRGAAFVAKASDPSAPYHNPAGLARQRGTQLLLNANLYLHSFEFQRLGAYPDDPKDSATPWVARAQQLVADTAAAVALAGVQVAKTGGRCVDVQELERLAAEEPSPEVAEVFRNGARARRSSNAKLAPEKLDGRLKRARESLSEEVFASASRPDGSCDSSDTYPLASCMAGDSPPKRIEEFRAEIDAVDCYLSEEQRAVLVKLVDALTARLAELTEKETACRRSPACLGARILAAACAWDVTAAELRRSIAKERANPAGVVDLRRLHGWGAEAQEADDRARELRATYRSVTSRAAPACPR